MAEMLSPARLRELLEYDEETGLLFWLDRTAENWPEATPARRAAWNRRYAFKEALIGVDGFGYRQGTIFGRYYKAHRVAWAIHFGEWPEGEIDHENGDNQDNRIANLRSVDHTTNLRNCRRSKRNTSGVTGVWWNKVHEKWQAGIRVNGKVKNLGAFTNFDDAVAARKRAENEAGYHERHGEVRTTANRFVPKRARL